MTEQAMTNTREYLAGLDKARLQQECKDIYLQLSDDDEKAAFEDLCIERAAALKCKTVIDGIFRELHRGERTQQKREKAKADHDARIARMSVSMSVLPDDVPLEINRVGAPAKTIDNYLCIMQFDEYYKGLRFNELSGRYEMHDIADDGTVRDVKPWDDTERAKSLYHIETEYSGLRDNDCHDNAFRIMKERRSFNPITSRIESLPAWDGVERCKTFLTDVMKADGSAYTQAVSQMLFDGAIARAFIPGCKYDNVIVLVGNQGCGKTTLCECLALSDEYHTEIKVVDDKAVENLRGKWIVEIGEMFAVTGAQSQDKVKSFITARKDDYRIPYDKYPNQYQRRCIFIGDTNRDEFLADPTGERRWYPVKLYADYRNGARLNENRDLLIGEIELCYAESYYRLQHNELMLTIPEDLVKEAERRQKEAQEIPWYIPEIERYIREDMDIGEKTYALQLWRSATLQDEQSYEKHKRKLSQYLHNMTCLEYIGNQRFPDADGYTTQKAYRKISNPE